MAITFFNNWRTREEFRVIEITFKSYHNPEQVGFCVSLLGFGIVFIKNRF